MADPMPNMNEGLEDYMKYRGKCQEMSQEAVQRDPTLTLVRGYYMCPYWGKQPHWWTTRPDGSVFDPTKDQFPSAGEGEYIPFDGWFNCSNCNKRIKEEDGQVEGNYIFCSNKCYGQLVGLFDENGDMIKEDLF